MILERGGLRIGIVGMTPPETARIVMGADEMGLEFLSVTAAAKAQAKALEATTDVLLFLTHLGPEKDVDGPRGGAARAARGGRPQPHAAREADPRGPGQGRVDRAGGDGVRGGRHACG